jgi:hypothetical protein
MGAVDKQTSVRHDPSLGNTVLNYHKTLPDGLAPMVVLDASGRVRELYKQWAQRGAIVPLKSAPKSYKNLTVNYWEVGGSKSAFRKNGGVLLSGIAEVVNSKLDQDWLVVHHKSGIGMDFPSELRRRLKGKKRRVQFLTWGQHASTNAYRDVTNIVLAGSLFYPDSHIEALARLAINKRPEDGPVPRDLEKAIALGESKNLVMQALGRASVRGCKDGVCDQCEAWIIASHQSGITGTLDEIFPDCKRVSWNHVEKPISGRAKQAAEYVVDWFEQHPAEDFLRFCVVGRAIDVHDATNFRITVRQNSDFKAALEAHGIEEARGRRGFVKTAQRVTNELFPE